MDYYCNTPLVKQSYLNVSSWQRVPTIWKKLHPGFSLMTFGIVVQNYATALAHVLVWNLFMFSSILRRSIFSIEATGLEPSHSWFRRVGHVSKFEGTRTWFVQSLIVGHFEGMNLTVQDIWVRRQRQTQSLSPTPANTHRHTYTPPTHSQLLSHTPTHTHTIIHTHSLAIT